MGALLIVFTLLLLFELAAWRWGYDSRDGFNSVEWEQRRNWLGFH